MLSATRFPAAILVTLAAAAMPADLPAQNPDAVSWVFLGAHVFVQAGALARD